MWNLDGSLQASVLPAVAGLSTESAGYHYNDVGLLASASGKDTYLNGVTYTSLGQLRQLILGPTSCSTNDFNNLVPVLRTVHQQEFNSWWMNYGG